MLGLAAILLSVGFVRGEGLWRWLGWVLLASGLTSVLAFLFLGAGSETFHLALTLSSAGLTLVLAALAAMVGHRLSRNEGAAAWR